MDGLFILIMLLIPYMIPSIIAYRRWHRSYKAIIALNILLGWTFLGWVVCLVWSLSGDTEPKTLVEMEPKDLVKKYFIVSADTKERIKGFYTDDGALKSIDDNGLKVSNVSKNAEGGMDFTVEVPS